MNTFSSIRSGSGIVSKKIQTILNTIPKTLYVSGIYASNPLTIYNSNYSTFKTLSNSGGNDIFIANYSQDGCGQWVSSITGTGSESPVNILLDQSDNRYIIGYYNSSITIYHSNNSVFKTLNNSGNNDIFIAKYNTDGSGQWVSQISGTGDDRPADIKIDKLNNIYISGYYNSSITIYHSNNNVFKTLSNSGNYDLFIAKYNNSGTAQWVSKISGEGDERPINSVYNYYLGFGTNMDVPVNIELDSSNNVYVSGYYYSTPLTVYNSNNSVFNTLDNSGYNDIFIVKYDSNGFAKWSTRIGGGGIESPVNLLVDNKNNVYINGNFYFSTPLIFYHSNNSIFTTLTTTDSTQIFVSKYNTDGSCQWVTRIGGNNVSRPVNMVVDLSYNVYISGHYNSSTFTIYSSDNSISKTFDVSGGYDIFVAKYNSSGILQWGIRVGGTDNDFPTNILVDKQNNLYLYNFSTYPSSIIFYNADSSIFNTYYNIGGNTGRYDVFLAKYNTSGFGIWSTRISGNYEDGPVNMVLDSNSNIYVSGNYVSTQLAIYNSNGSMYNILDNSGTATRPWTNGEIFIAKYNRDGSAQWVTRIGGTGIDNVINMRIK
jgi:hypothetical protein